MWPFKKKTDVRPQAIAFTQLDTTDGFGDNAKLGPDDWVETTPLSQHVEGAEAQGLPPAAASDDAIYQTASRLSETRESFSLPDDGVYCPVCHIANTDQQRLRTPCPTCGRPLLKFGWD
jgi:hypothetical protein